MGKDGVINSRQIQGFVQLLLAALIWGVAFVAQSAGMEYIGAYTFSFLRFIVGGVVLIPCMVILRKLKTSDEVTSDVSGSGQEISGNIEARTGRKSQGYRSKSTFIGGICCGIILCAATNLQQLGIKYTSVGKAGFITSLYIVLVPLFGIFLKKKTGIKVWGSVALAAAGMYLLCMSEALAIGRGDMLVMLCAVVFAGHILVVDHFAPYADGVMMSCVQFFTAGILSGIPMLILEEINISAIISSAVPVLYTGVLSSGVAYTLQIIGQKNMNPTAACMIMSLESVFSVLAGALILHQLLTVRELLGCVLMFIAIILS